MLERSLVETLFSDVLCHNFISSYARRTFELS